MLNIPNHIKSNNLLLLGLNLYGFLQTEVY